MASKINADEFVDREGEGKPTLPQGVVLSGVTTITTATVADNEVVNSTGINAGIITSTHFKGNLTGDVNAGIVTVTSQTVIGSAVTISSQGIDIGAGVITATSYAGGGGNLTGIGATIMVWEYNPDPYDTGVTVDTGIGITFNQKIKAGSGNITLRKDSASGTVVENFGIGSSVTIAGNSLIIDPTSDLDESQLYHLSLPAGVITNMAGESYVGTAYTFQSQIYNYNLFSWGMNPYGQLGQNHNDQKLSSPVQIPGTTWKYITDTERAYGGGGIKSDGTLWGWGNNTSGGLGLNDVVRYSSPVQVGSDTTWSWAYLNGEGQSYGIKTDGTLWSWGSDTDGRGGRNTGGVNVSSPTQIGSGTDWATGLGKVTSTSAIKTDGTLWTWGSNQTGKLGVPSIPTGNPGTRSSPIQVPGTTWNTVSSSTQGFTLATKTDGTLWGWGSNTYGRLGDNSTTQRSSPTQIPGSIWAYVEVGYNQSGGTKTDGTLWVWGMGNTGIPGTNRTTYSSPIQIPGTWKTGANQMTIGGDGGRVMAVQSDGTLWAWGTGESGELGQNQNGQPGNRSSPTQVGSGTDWNTVLVNQNGGAYATTRST